MISWNHYESINESIYTPEYIYDPELFLSHVNRQWSSQIIKQKNQWSLLSLNSCNEEKILRQILKN